MLKKSDFSAGETSGAVIERVEVFPLRLPVRKAFKFAGGTVCEEGGQTPHVFVKIIDSDGAYGWGEARPCPGWSSETFETVASSLKKYIAPALLGLDVSDRFNLHARLDRVLGGNPTGQPIARCAVDVAVHDLLSRRANVPLRAFLGGSAQPATVALSYTITDFQPEPAADSVSREREVGFRHFNFKSGVDAAVDVSIATAIRKGAGSNAFLWADANQSLDISSARRLARAFEAVGVDLLEQPLIADAQHVMGQLRAATCLPLAIDEACVSATDYYRYVASGLVDYLIIKVNRSGGIWPSIQQLGVALAARQGIVLSGLAETLLTRCAGSQLACAYGCTGPAALNGGQFLDESELFPEKNETERDGLIHLNNRPGIGVEPNLRAVERLAAEAEL